MKTITYFLFSICVLCFSFSHSQVTDKENKSIRIPAETSNTNKDSIPEKIKVAPKLEAEKSKSTSGISSENFKSYSSETKKKSFSMIHNDGLRNPGEIFEARWRKEAAKGGIIRTMSDQFLGEHKVDTEFVNIVCRDHQFPDGDRVRIYIDDYVVVSNLTLTSQYRRVKVNLVDGKNKIDIEALNQGESGPNTAEFIVYDDKGNVVSSKEWNLLTGVKATIIFVNEKVTIKPKSETASNNN